MAIKTSEKRRYDINELVEKSEPVPLMKIADSYQAELTLAAAKAESQSEDFEK